MPAPGEQLQTVLNNRVRCRQPSRWAPMYVPSHRSRGCPCLKLALCPAWPVDASHYAIWHSRSCTLAGCPPMTVDGVKARAHCRMLPIVICSCHRPTIRRSTAGTQAAACSRRKFHLSCRLPNLLMYGPGQLAN